VQTSGLIDDLNASAIGHGKFVKPAFQPLFNDLATNSGDHTNNERHLIITLPSGQSEAEKI
jgi:hypothetical protein